MSNPGAIYTDGDFTVVTPVTLPELSSPIQGVNTKYILTQEFVQLEANFTALALNTAYPNTAGSSTGADFAGDNSLNAAGYILVEEGPLRDIGAGVVRWQRRYAIVPQPHYDPIQVQFQFPGYLAVLGVPAVMREPFTRAVPGTIEYAYFLAGTNTHDAVQSLETTNFVSQQLFLWPHITEIPLPNEQLQVSYIWTNSSPQPTIPNLEEYSSWVSTGTHPIVAQPSQFSRWEGNIIRREVITIIPV